VIYPSTATLVSDGTSTAVLTPPSGFGVGFGEAFGGLVSVVDAVITLAERERRDRHVDRGAPRRTPTRLRGQLVAADFVLKSHDRLPSIQATLSADLTTAIGVNFIMKAVQGNTVKVNAAATIVDAARGRRQVRLAGRRHGLPRQLSGRVGSSLARPEDSDVPDDSYHSIDILADLDGAA
jgi:hypothetical protein